MLDTLSRGKFLIWAVLIRNFRVLLMVSDVLLERPLYETYVDWAGPEKILTNMENRHILIFHEFQKSPRMLLTNPEMWATEALCSLTWLTPTQKRNSSALFLKWDVLKSRQNNNKASGNSQLFEREIGGGGQTQYKFCL
jgi:hypothetical protein